MSHILQFVDVIGRYAVDSEGNVLPRRRTWTGKYGCHTGKEVWIHSTLAGADSSDFQQFTHTHDSPAWMNREFGGRMVTVTQEMGYDYHSGMWYYSNTIHSAR
jgi:hypothetical protein